MNDRPNESAPMGPPPETFEQRLERLAAAAKDAGEKLLAAMAAQSDALKEHSWLSGWDKGFNQGWKAASVYFTQQAEKERAARAETPIPPANLNRMMPPSSLSTPMQIPTASELVHQFINDRPGLRGFEIADHFSKAVFPLPERTVRTALHRLKKSGLITVVNTRWYTPDKVPIGSQLEMTEG